MIAIDTNVLVRFLVKDDLKQSALASAIIQRTLSEKQNIFVPDVVIVETVWVLRRSYKFSKAEVCSILRELLAARGVRFNAPDTILKSLQSYEAGKGDFSDYVIREQSLNAECSEVFTFDRALLDENGFSSP